MTMIQTNSGCHQSTRRFDLGSIARFILHAIAVKKERLALRKLDDAALHDLGLSREEIAREAGRKIWDVPSNWRK